MRMVLVWLKCAFVLFLTCVDESWYFDRISTLPNGITI